MAVTEGDRDFENLLEAENLEHTDVRIKLRAMQDACRAEKTVLL